MKKLLITGGHFTPAHAVIEALMKEKKFDLVFVGRKFAYEGDKQETAEYTVVNEMGIPWYTLQAGRVTKKISMYSIISLVKIPLGCIQALGIIWKEKPDIILSFGGYIALPVAMAGWIFHIPIVTHEQTRNPGLTNRIIAKFAAVVCISWKEAIDTLPKGKIVGLPIRRSILTAKKEIPNFLPKKSKSILYITGGSAGAITMNDVVFEVIPELVKSNTIIHQTGEHSFAQAMRLKQTLGKEWEDHYIPLKQIEGSDVGWILHHATAVIGRSGANTVAEVMAIGVPMLAIPLPWARHDEQTVNANVIVKTKQGLLMSQESLSKQSLTEAIENIIEHEKDYRKQPTNTVSAVQMILDILTSLV